MLTTHQEPVGHRRPTQAPRLLMSLGLALLLPVTAWTQAMELDDAWYRVEIILFERSQATDSREETLALAPRWFPNAPLALRKDGEALRAHLRISDDEYSRMHERLPATEIVATWPEDRRPEHWQAYLPQEQRRQTDFDQFQFDDTAADDETNGNEADDLALAQDEPPADADDAPAVSDEPAPLTEQERRQRQLAALERDLQQRALTPLPADQHELNGAASRLRGSGQTRVIVHRAWIQRAEARENPQPVLLQAGNWHRDRYAYEGTLSLTRGRFLHFHAQLWRDPDGQPARAERPFETLDESRRMRSGELHYLDHPHFGVLVLVNPVPIPELPDLDEVPMQPSNQPITRPH